MFFMKKPSFTAVLALGACTLFARDAQFAAAPYVNPRLSTKERIRLHRGNRCA